MSFFGGLFIARYLTATLCLLVTGPVVAETGQDVRQHVEPVNQGDNARIQSLEARMAAIEDGAQVIQPANRSTAAKNSFNPALSLILNGQYIHYSRSPDEDALPGFSLGPEAGLDQEGFSLGESEVILSANTDQHWRGQMTLSLADDQGETRVEVEEAYIETLGLGDGLTFRAGRFFSGIGYLNGKHAHAWNFSDAPLVYRGLMGGQIKQDGLRLNWALPLDKYVELGLEAGNGQGFPAGGSHDGVGDWAVFVKTGGDIGASASWQLGLSHYQADAVDGRVATTHQFSGDSKINGLDLVYKWSPNGNDTERALVVQAEYFQRDEAGQVSSIDGNNLGRSTIDARQEGGYIEGIYKFRPHWRAGLRYDRLSSDNQGNPINRLQQFGLLDEGHHPHRGSAMLEWIPSEFSRIRLQYNRDNSVQETDHQVIFQYTQALGSHGAHQF
ncbi:MAG TPA: hypothetical protein ENJ84_14600 [Gammaproteobacteria bacterium]|nr:hypothetical protein [Gammaproteobacteria bacterium]